MSIPFWLAKVAVNGVPSTSTPFTSICYLNHTVESVYAKMLRLSCVKRVLRIGRRKGGMPGCQWEGGRVSVPELWAAHRLHVHAERPPTQQVQMAVGL